MTDQALDDLIRCDFATPLGRCILAAGHYPASVHRYPATDYRAEAEAWLRSAAAGETQRESIEFALIGIGHALLALGAAQHGQDTMRRTGWFPIDEHGNVHLPLSPSEG